MAEKPSEESLPQSAVPPDDVWEKFLQDSRADIPASAPKEPSARARMVTERLRAMDEARAAAAAAVAAGSAGGSPPRPPSPRGGARGLPGRRPTAGPHAAARCGASSAC
ncbi:hypothetical protein [Streptomyces sp. DH-12]|uniref:hypothetical protein n=1 Tax=Streptomyces sp. DH-12 TaxID=2072509 RepID=UPI001F534A27|nr:hypothetical protein [Streptomyces sp. DH-12]